MKQAIEKYRGELESIREAGTWREERVITTPPTLPHRHHPGQAGGEHVRQQLPGGSATTRPLIQAAKES